VLTDGADHASHHSEKELRLRLRSVNLPIYVVTFNETDRRQYGYTDLYRGGRRQTFGTAEAFELDRGVIAELSKTSGGPAFERSIQNRVYLASVFRKVLAEVQNQYVIGFYSENADGKWHKLKISVKDGTKNRLKVSSRKGYQSPVSSLSSLSSLSKGYKAHALYTPYSCSFSASFASLRETFREISITFRVKGI
jgi:VWFA-related protein